MAKNCQKHDFNETENRLYQWWWERGYFEPGNDRTKRLRSGNCAIVISIPPANVTGSLHLGHAIVRFAEDLMIRYHRMKVNRRYGCRVWTTAGSPPSCRWRICSVSRAPAVRPWAGKFEETVWAWKEKYGGIITQQIRRLGASCDLDPGTLYLDEGLSRAVGRPLSSYEKDGFTRAAHDQLVTGLMTAVSDLEVEYSEEPGKLYYFKYMIAGSDEFIPVATTRPETILGDTAVAVHPEDERYGHLVGKKAIVPILGREIPVIADDYVDREFGTGALKITPAHDPHDYEIGARHNLETINILNKDATINEEGGPYAGMDRFDCRKKLWADMEAANLVIKEEPYKLKVPRSQRAARSSSRWCPRSGLWRSTRWRRPPWTRSRMAGLRSSGALQEGLLQLDGEH